MKRSLPGQRVGAKAWVDFFTEYLAEELNYSGFRVDGAICKGWFGRTPIHLWVCAIYSETETTVQVQCPRLGRN